MKLPSSELDYHLRILHPGTKNYLYRHYQDAYAMLLTMCGSTAVLPPRTKRWAEAKVLADCISIKVVFFFTPVCPFCLLNAHGRFVNYTSTIMNTVSPCPRTAYTHADSQSSREGGESGKRRLNFGVGWRGSTGCLQSSWSRGRRVVSLLFQTTPHNLRRPANSERRCRDLEPQQATMRMRWWLRSV
jgi:hypothetical protein